MARIPFHLKGEGGKLHRKDNPIASKLFRERAENVIKVVKTNNHCLNTVRKRPIAQKSIFASAISRGLPNMAGNDFPATRSLYPRF